MDDVLVMGKLEADLSAVKRYLDNAFTITDLGYIKYFLGLEVARADKGMVISQHKYILNMLIDFGMENCTATTTHLPFG